MVEIRKTQNFSKWLKGLKDRKGAAIVAGRIARIEFGNFGDSKSVGGGVSELRIAFGPGYRVYFTKVGEQIVILLAGGDKSSQGADIKLAKELAKAV